jgi:hypothetical protein
MIVILFPFYQFTVILNSQTNMIVWNSVERDITNNDLDHYLSYMDYGSFANSLELFHWVE